MAEERSKAVDNNSSVAVSETCLTAVQEVYKEKLERMKRTLDELRSSQKVVETAVEECKVDMEWQSHLEQLVKRMDLLPAYIAKSQDIAKDMKGLRLRMDRAKSR
eukprot:CAMPEP_0197852614 /NCGR_PEP_ID=MMETSP1438-20131217/21069_1 /TAXON_ID=1461541 /ORGANISM="Pterosperma sp., Strain CCMP1384" /LENGTH=104 /DNA_ID=CAMNT_0043466757 /DNA_START=425 /DNA_END=735 /DNA_ORIENTATION=+